MKVRSTSAELSFHNLYVTRVPVLFDCLTFVVTIDNV